MASSLPAASLDDYKQRQDDELLSITAIYPNEVTDLRNNKAWKNWKPLELQISITPCSITSDTKDEITTKADLIVKCPVDYPSALPSLDVQNTKGLSTEDVNNLKKELDSIAKGNLGNEMLYDLINCTQNFLREHQKPHYASFYDEMLHNQWQQQQKVAEEEEKKMEAQKLVDEEKLLAIEAEFNKKREALKLANRKVKTQESTMKLEIGRPRSRSESSCKDVCTGTVRTTLKFKGKKDFSVFCGKCMSHNKRGCVVYYGMDTMSGDPVAVIKWTLNWQISVKPKADELEAIRAEQEQYMKQLKSLEQEFQFLCGLKHDNLAHYLGMSYVQKKDKIIIYILQEYVSGCPLSLMSNEVPLSIHQIQSYTHHILQAIQYLHEKSVIHKSIRDTCIFISSNGHVKLSDYSVDQKLYNMYLDLTKELKIDKYPPSIGKGGKKCDIYRLGTMLLACTGHSMSQDGPIKIPDSLNPFLKDFIEKCLTHDEHERWSVEKLLSHVFMAQSSVATAVPSRYEYRNVEKEDSTTKDPSLGLDSSHNSRLSKEFELLQCVGRGTFGLVYKVRNLLDSRIYALKKISLSTTSKHLEKKMKREVKVLSRLNHENIVRYFNSWIEESLKSIDQSSANTTSYDESDIGLSETGLSIQWDMHNDKNDVSSSEEEDDIEDQSIIFEAAPHSSNSIIFQQSNDGNDNLMGWTNEDSTIIEPKKSRNIPKDVVEKSMFIQMEFCEKSTLRSAIDNGLHQDIPRIWRLFREIVEGLVHIHQQGVIHRDLKPVNIFLDSNEHVKIGDFGLATDVLSKSKAFDFPTSPDQSMDLVGQHSLEYPDDGLCTGNVGTTLYVAPEVSSTKAKLGYTQKVDIYSLGIIFFEMCYPPTVTLSERCKLITNLRQQNIGIPTDKPLSSEMVYILKWLLQHDVSKRPTSLELSTSEYIPPPLIEETELHNILRNTVGNSQTRSYKYLINCLFDQNVPAEFDFTYDKDVPKAAAKGKSRLARVFCDVVEVLNKILKTHGAVKYSVPTLMPKSAIYNNDTCVYLIDHGGSVFNLPHDLRVPFARHIARHDVTQLKRFSLEKVYREEKVFGFHPREQYEYAFDIVTPTRSSCIPDAEILTILSKIVCEFPSLESSGYCIYLNHASILNGIIKYCDISQTEEAVIYNVFDNQRNRNASKLHVQHLLIDAGLDEEKAAKFVQYVDVSENIDKISNLLQPLSQKKGDVGTLVKKGLNDLKSVVKYAESFGVKLPILISPCLIHEMKIYSSIVFQVACDTKAKKKKSSVILAAGGRYDNLIASFKFKSSLDFNKSHNQTAVGASVAIEKIVAMELDSRDQGKVDFVVYSNQEIREQATTLLKDLWSFNYSAFSLYDKSMSLNDVVDHCQNNNVSHLLMMSPLEQGIVKVRSFDKEKISEKKLSYLEFMEQLKSGNFKAIENSQPAKVEFQRSSSIGATVPVINVRFLSQEKIYSHRKRELSIKSSVLSKLQPTLNRSWEIIALDLKMTVVGCIVSLFNVNKSDESIRHELAIIADSHSKCKKYLLQLCDEICDIMSKKNFIVILYSLTENDFRVIL